MSMLVTCTGEGKSALDSWFVNASTRKQLSVRPSIIVSRSAIGFENRGAMFAGSTSRTRVITTDVIIDSDLVVT
ncbi:MAG: hypothetical protein AABO57_09750 [Acidobacteriota bacterium]